MKSELIGIGEYMVNFPAAAKTPRRFYTALHRVAACFAVASFSNLLSDVAQAVAAGNNFWFRFDVPLISTAPVNGLAGPR